MDNTYILEKLTEIYIPEIEKIAGATVGQIAKAVSSRMNSIDKLQMTIGKDRLLKRTERQLQNLHEATGKSIAKYEDILESATSTKAIISADAKMSNSIKAHKGIDDLKGYVYYKTEDAAAKLEETGYKSHTSRRSMREGAARYLNGVRKSTSTI